MATIIPTYPNRSGKNPPERQVPNRGPTMARKAVSIMISVISKGEKTMSLLHKDHVPDT